ncbi:MAG: tRNA (adenosine(37)-N6)-threonylcarbamoyltransferase complex transferase subunit TsaD [Gemmataceae bacterium]|nr:tRNA (adenosine(37)-N6)-threonylcarbamoyltransferase complex transferase subunit TsaD [Gemmataceae bacterium]
MNFLALETSCDETSAAVFTDELKVLSNVVASQTSLHARFGGVVPEVAAREHLRQILPVVDEALRRAGVGIHEIGCIAVHNTPGLVGALLIGLSAAKGLAAALDVPLIGVNHIHAHIYAARLAAGRDIFPCVGLVVSGGHTALFDCSDAVTYKLMGTTRDDAAGEAFDKVATILGLGFPGGPALDRAATGNPKAHKFPRSYLEAGCLDFSFSGLKTAVLYAVQGHDRANTTPPTGTSLADFAASFQEAVVDVLVTRCGEALDRTGTIRLAVGGGVSANRRLRTALQAMCERRGAELFLPPMEYCTDNAAMAALAVEHYRRGQFAGDDLDAIPYVI